MSSNKTGNPPKIVNFDSFVQLSKVINRFENEYSDEYMVKWLNILRVMQENGISNNAANRLTQLIANFFGSDVQPLSLEEVEAIMKERGLESTNTE